MNLRRKIFIRIEALIVLLVVSVSGFYAIFVVRFHRQEMKYLFKTRAQVLMAETERMILWDDRVAVKRLITNTVNTHKNVEYIFVEKDGQPYAHTFSKGVPRTLLGRHGTTDGTSSVWEYRNSDGSVFYDIAVTVRHSTSTVLHMGLQRDMIDRETRPLLVNIAFLGLSIIIIGAGLAILITRWTTHEVDRLTEALRESEKRYRALFENAADAILLIEAEGEKLGDIVDANRAAAEMHGYSFDELLGLNLIRDLIPPDAAKDVPNRVKRMMNGEWIKAEITHRKKDNTVFPVEICSGPLEINDHKYILAIDRDITKRKMVLEHLLRVEQMRLVGEWAVGLSDEIKNSLAGIKVSIEVLLEELDISAEDRAIVLKAADEIKRTELLLKNLLNFAKPPKLQNMIINMNDLLDQAVTFSLGPPFLSSNSLIKIKISKDFDENVPAMMADPFQMRQVFINLAINAIEAMPEGGILGFKSIYDKNANAIKIEISDTGKGIDKGMMDDVFKPFFTTKLKGSGLGLAIIRRVVEQHGGDISVKSDPGKWTTFNVYLPVITSRDKETEVILTK